MTDHQQLLKIINNYQKLSTIIKDYQQLLKIINNY
jgi:hypothetical protein